MRNGAKASFIFNGYLDDLLLGLYAQTPQFELYHKQRGLTHKVLIDFGGTIKLTGQDELVCEFRAQNTSFVGLNVNNSSIQIESVPSSDYQSPIFVVDSVGIPTSETNVTLGLGDNVVKSVVITDRDANY